jgi:hypothetical protein
VSRFDAHLTEAGRDMGSLAIGSFIISHQATVQSAP